MNKYRIPEMLIGALLAVAIFAIGASSGLLANPTESPPSAKEAPGPVYLLTKPELDGRTWLTKDAAGFFAFVAAAIAALQAYFFLRQLRLMNDGLKDSRKAAEAAAAAVDLARTNGQHQMRAYVGADGIRKEPVPASSAIAEWQLHVNWLNRGQTPALDVRGNFAYLKYGTSGIPANFDLGVVKQCDLRTSGEYMTPTGRFLSNPVTILVAEIDAAKSVGDRIYVCGYIEYDDVFQGTDRHRLEFCDEVIFYGSPSDPNCDVQMHNVHHAVFDLGPSAKPV